MVMAMSRGRLDDSDMERISQELPEIGKLGEVVLGVAPDSLRFRHFPPESDIPVATVCFLDALYTLEEAEYALSEVLAHQLWYLEREKPPNKMSATFFGRFYSDNAALRLYSAGEHLANAIIMMLQICDQQLKPYREKRTSQQSVVGNYLRKEKTNHPITKEVTKLADSNEWQATMRYRNRWVHEQPPTVADMGTVYKRRRRCETLPDGKGRILRGGGDAPEYSVEDLVGFIKPAMFKFTDTLTSVVKFYIEILEAPGSIRFNTQQEGGKP